jgi:hypothetical protein
MGVPTTPSLLVFAGKSEKYRIETGCLEDAHNRDDAAVVDIRGVLFPPAMDATDDPSCRWTLNARFIMMQMVSNEAGYPSLFDIIIVFCRRHFDHPPHTARMSLKASNKHAVLQ